MSSGTLRNTGARFSERRGGEPMQPTEASLCVLFADVSGSTHLYESLGDSRALTLISRCLREMQAVIERNRGRIVKTVGDEIVCVLPAADDGIQAASEIQAHLEVCRQTDTSLPSVRIGVAFGPLLAVGDDVFGDTVNLAARVVGLAKGDQILTTAPTVDALPPFARTSCRPLYAINVKGKEAPVAIFEIVWKVDGTLTVLTGRGMVVPDLLHRLRVSYKQLEILLDGEHRVLSVGRSGDNELVVSTKMASRHHARLFIRDGKFVLADESANGTYVRFDERDEMMLRREETVLVGCGVIGLGQSPVPGEDEAIRFEVV